MLRFFVGEVKARCEFAQFGEPESAHRRHHSPRQRPLALCGAAESVRVGQTLCKSSLKKPLPYTFA